MGGDDDDDEEDTRALITGSSPSKQVNTLGDDGDDGGGGSGVLDSVKELTVNHAKLVFTNMFPQPPESQDKGPLQFRDIIESEDIPGFLQMFCRGFAVGGGGDGDGDDDDGGGLSELVGAVVDEISKEVSSQSILGDFRTPLNRLIRLCAVPEIAWQVVRNPRWNPANARNGREIEIRSILGPFLRLSWLPDIWQFNLKPNVMQLCFSKPMRNLRDLKSNLVTLRTEYNGIVK